MSDSPPVSNSEDTFLYLGFHTAYWNRAEEALDALLVCAIGDSAKAHILTSGANAARRTQYLKAIYEECCAEKPWLETALAAVAAFDALRKNRNVLAHGVALGLDEADGTMDLKVQTLNPNKRLHKRVRATQGAVAEQVLKVMQLNKHLRLLRRHIYHRDGAYRDIADVLSERPPLPDRLPLPALLQTPETENYTEPLIRRGSPPAE